MLNDVSFPPLDEPDEFSPPKRRTGVAKRPLLPAEHPFSDVTLFDHPDFSATGAGNFWLLGFIGVLVLALAAIIAWVMLG